MQPLSDGPENLGGLILVRSAAEVPLAVRVVRDLLALAQGESSRQVLGVVAGAGLEPGFSRRPSGAIAPITLRESVGFSGIWNLCWFDLGPLARRQHAGERRRRLLDGLRPALEGTLFPVFTPPEVREGLSQLVEDLEARYPALAMGRDCFVHELSPRGLSRLSARSTSLQLH